MDKYHLRSAPPQGVGSVEYLGRIDLLSYVHPAMQTVDFFRKCAECNLAGCTPGDYLCADCRVELTPVEGHWHFGGVMDGVHCRVWILSRYEGYAFVMERNEHRKVYAVGTASVVPV